MGGLIAEAAANGARIIVFPETFVSEYPLWLPDVFNERPEEHAHYIGRSWYEYWDDFVSSAIPVPGDATRRIGWAAHLRAVTVETMNIFAAEPGVQPSSTTSFACRSRALGVSAALAWDTKASWLLKRFLDSSTSQPEAFAFQQLRVVSRNNVPGHHT